MLTKLFAVLNVSIVQHIYSVWNLNFISCGITSYIFTICESVCVQHYGKLSQVHSEIAIHLKTKIIRVWLKGMLYLIKLYLIYLEWVLGRSVVNLKCKLCRVHIIIRIYLENLQNFLMDDDDRPTCIVLIQ